MQYLKDYKDAYDIIFQGIKLIVEIILMAVTVAKGIGTLTKYIEDKRNKQVLEYMKSFLETKRKQRLGGVNGLVHYASDMFNELFYLCAFEEDILIRGLLWDALIRVSRRKKKKCKRMNNFLIKHSLREDIFIKSIDIQEKRDKMWNCLRNGRTNDQMQFGTEYEGTHIRFKNDKAVEKCLLLSSQLMSGALKKVVNQKLDGIIFFKSSLKEALWINCSLYNSAVAKMQGKGAKGIKIRIEEVFLWGNKFPEGHFWGLQCKKLDIYRTNFTQASFSFISLFGADYESGKTTYEHNNKCSAVERVTFDNGKFNHVKVMFYQIRQSSWIDCGLERCNFANVIFSLNRWYGKMTCAHSGFKEVKFCKERIQGTFKRCKFENVEWDDSNLQESKFVRCKFKNIKFINVDMKNVKFEKCRFLGDSIVFKDIKNANYITGKEALKYIQTH